MTVVVDERRLKVDSRSPRLRTWARDQFPQPLSYRWSFPDVALAGASAALGVILLLLQDRGPSPLDSVWYEDGTIFLADALNLPFLTALTRPYMGYLHFYPRLMGEVAARLPLGWAAEFFSLTSAVTIVSVAILTYYASAAHLRSRTIRFALAATLVVHPTAIVESYQTVSHVHWFLAYAALWMLLWRPISAPAIALAALVAVVAALSGPVVILFLPLAALRLIGVTGIRERIVPVVLSVAAGVQFAVLSAMVVPAEEASTTSSLLILYSQRVLTAGLISQVLTSRLWPLLHDWLPTIVGLIAFGVGLTCLLRARARFRVLVVALVSLSVFSFIMMTRTRGQIAGMFLADPIVWRQSRLSVIPILLLYVAGALLLDQLLRTVKTTGRRALMALPLVALAFLATTNLLQPQPTGMLLWTAEVARGQELCSRKEASSVILRVPPNRVHIRRPKWTFEVPCSYLRDPERHPFAVAGSK